MEDQENSWCRGPASSGASQRPLQSHFGLCNRSYSWSWGGNTEPAIAVSAGSEFGWFGSRVPWAWSFYRRPSGDEYVDDGFGRWTFWNERRQAGSASAGDRCYRRLQRDRRLNFLVRSIARSATDRRLGGFAHPRSKFGERKTSVKRAILILLTAVLSL